MGDAPANEVLPHWIHGAVSGVERPKGPIPQTMTLDVACDILCSQHGISHATSRVIVSGIEPLVSKVLSYF